MFKILHKIISILFKPFHKSGKIIGLHGKKIFGKQVCEKDLLELERLLYSADAGSETTHEIIRSVKERMKENKSDRKSILKILETELVCILEKYADNSIVKAEGGLPKVILMVGINGSGKTTSTAKMGYYLKQKGYSVLLAAGDTFRAAAIEQLTHWAEKLDLDIVKSIPNSDPASVAFDAISAGKARKCDYVIIDTAGRLQGKLDLMQELEKIRRSSNKALKGAPHETFLVLDASIGQNAIDQAKTFHQYTPITGIILTKLDGSAKGGVVLAIQRELGVPVKFIGLGEQAEDLHLFECRKFAEDLLS